MSEPLPFSRGRTPLRDLSRDRYDVAPGREVAPDPPSRSRRRRKRTGAESRVTSERWLFSYADFVTLLFALFAVLFAASRHNQSELHRLSGAIHSGFQTMGALPPSSSAAGKPAPSTVAAQLTRELHPVLGDSLERGEVSLSQTGEGFVISFRELGFFNSGQAGLLPGAAQKVIGTGEILKQHGYTLRVEGHSDDQPIHNATFNSNWELSAARAMTVLLLLVDQSHYDPTRVSVAGYGPYRPVADNATPNGRRQNRRVDLVIVQP